MSHKDAPPLDQQQFYFEAWWAKRVQGTGVTLAFGRDRHGQYFSEFVRDAWAAWKEAREQGRSDYHN